MPIETCNRVNFSLCSFHGMNKKGRKFQFPDHALSECGYLVVPVRRLIGRRHLFANILDGRKCSQWETRLLVVLAKC